VTNVTLWEGWDGHHSGMTSVHAIVSG